MIKMKIENLELEDKISELESDELEVLALAFAKGKHFDLELARVKIRKSNNGSKDYASVLENLLPDEIRSTDDGNENYRMIMKSDVYLGLRNLLIDEYDKHQSSYLLGLPDVSAEYEGYYNA